MCEATQVDPSCDGVDDDCDGSFDEDFVSTATNCGVGACAATGSTSCVSGGVVDSCAPGAPAADDATCNAMDDDCDGSVDEDAPVGTCAPPRVANGLVVYYPFDEGSGTTAGDQSNNGLAMDLTLTGSVTWDSQGNGVVMSGGNVTSIGPGSKVISALQATSESTSSGVIRVTRTSCWVSREEEKTSEFASCTRARIRGIIRSY
jgi:hypothetical protein